MRKTLCAGLLTVAVMGLATSPTAAQVSSGMVQQTGSVEQWHDDGWRYVLRGGQWLRTGLYRAFPNPNNRRVFNLYENGRFIKRVDISDPRWHVEMPAAHFTATSPISWVAYPTGGPVTPQNLRFFVTSWGRWTTLQELHVLAARAAAVPDPNNASIAVRTVGGTQAFGGGTPLVGPDAGALAAQAGGLAGRIVGGRY